MLVKAIVSFGGLENMVVGEIKNLEDNFAKELIDAGYVEQAEKTKKRGKTNED